MPANKSSESQGTRLLKELFSYDKGVFNIEDIKNAAFSQHIPSNQVNKIISNLAKQNRLLRLQRGIYVGIDITGQIQVNPFVISGYLIQPSVISHWSALQHHGLTEQIPQAITASTTKKVVTPSMRKDNLKTNKKHAVIINGIRYEYITVSEESLKLGVEKIWVPSPFSNNHYQVEITDKERTLLDLFIHPSLFGGMGEALGILENALVQVDIERLINYALKYNKKALAKRLGWSLDYFGVNLKYLKPLLNVPIHYYCRLDSGASEVGTCDKKWMIQNNLMAKINESTPAKNKK